MASTSSGSSSSAAAPDRPLRILTLGMGALGSIYSFVLSQSRSPRCEMTCVARSNYATLRDPSVGMRIESEKFGSHEHWKPDIVYQDGNVDHQHLSQQVDYDFVLCCFKIVEEGSATSDVLRPWLKPRRSGQDRAGPTIVLIQNGIAIEDEPQRNLVDSFPHSYARGISTGVAWIGANLKDSGKVVTHGNMDKIQLGVFSGDPAHQGLFHKAYTSGRGTMELKDDIQPIRWSKLLWNTAWASMCSLSRQPVAALLDPAVLPYVAGPVRRTMLEVVSVARASGISEERMPTSAVDFAFNITYASRPEGDSAAPTLASDFKPSLTLDLEAGRPMELKAIIGNVVEIARRHRVDTPRLDLVLAALRASQVDALRKRNTLSSAEADAKSHGNRLTQGRPVDLLP